jgi:hypothetical protein
MRSSECVRFEMVVASGDQLDDALLEHARGCEPCRALAEIAALQLRPLPGGHEDPAARSVLAAARRVAEHRADHRRRRQRRGPLLIGLAGYLVAALTALVVLLPGPVGPTLPEPYPNVLTVALPPPSPTQIALVFAASALWTAAFILRVLGRRQGSQAGAGGR